MRILSNPGLSFDDVLLVPNRFEGRSRFSPEVDLSTDLFPTRSGRILNVPIVSANMDKVTETELAEEMYRCGGLGIIHRFMSIDNHVAQIRQLLARDRVGCIGVGAAGRDRAEALIDAGCNTILIDIAHGHCRQMIEQIKWLKEEYPAVMIIAGNVATGDGAADLITAGADCIKVGVGPGSLCTTRIHTGCGVPQVTAIDNVVQVVRSVNRPVTVIADGGIRTSGDIVKALAVGADAVMIGNLFAGADETPGQIYRDRNTGHRYKIYRGMASAEAQEEWKGFATSVEGEIMRVPCKGPVKEIVRDLTLRMRSAMTYLNANNLKELVENSRFIKVTSAGYKESTPHGLNRTEIL